MLVVLAVSFLVLVVPISLVHVLSLAWSYNIFQVRHCENSTIVIKFENTHVGLSSTIVQDIHDQFCASYFCLEPLGNFSIGWFNHVEARTFTHNEIPGLY